MFGLNCSPRFSSCTDKYDWPAVNWSIQPQHTKLIVNKQGDTVWSKRLDFIYNPFLTAIPCKGSSDPQNYS